MASGLHFLILPVMCPGHLIPMVDMAKLIAQQSVTVTILITPRNVQRYAAVLDRAVASGLPIRILQLRFSTAEYGLPDGCESLDDLPSMSLFKKFIDATGSLQQPLEDVFPELKPRPCCIISDPTLRWAADVAAKFQVPWVTFDGTSCFTQLCIRNLSVSTVLETVGDSDPFVLPGLPETITMTKSQLPGIFNSGKSSNAQAMKVEKQKARETESGAYGMLMNSFDELEGRFIEEYRKVTKSKVWCIGPFSQSHKNDLDKAQRGSSATMNDHDWLSWLDSQGQGSVIYACLGSLTRVTPAHFTELALGLEESGFPFILVVKGGSRPEEIQKWLAEDGFEERVKGRGVLIRGWVPQVLVLSHPAVGAFLTHCGWNSTLEGLCSGVPMITWPHFAEQFFNERVSVQVVGTSVAVGAQRVMHVGEEDAMGIQVRREDVCRAAKTIMDQGKKGEERRRKAKALREKAEKAMEEGGSSQLNLKLFIQHILQLHTKQSLAADL